MFTIPRPNVIASDQGFSVEVLGQTGLRYEEGGKTVFVDSEVLSGPSAMIIYPARMAHWDHPYDHETIGATARHRIVERIRDAC